MKIYRRRKDLNMSDLTKPDNMLHHLTEKQQIAIKELLQGKTDGEVAAITCVTRQTVNQWRNDNPFFQAELNKRRREAWEEFMQEYRELMMSSVQTIKAAVNNGDVKTARWFVEKVGLDMVIRQNMDIEPPMGLTDPDDILMHKAHKQAEMEIEKELKDPFKSADKIFEGEPTKMDIQKMIQKRSEKIYKQLKAAAEKQVEKLPDLAA